MMQDKKKKNSHETYVGPMSQVTPWLHHLVLQFPVTVLGLLILKEAVGKSEVR